MMWQVWIGVLNSETLRQIKIRTSNRLSKVDIALARCQYNHYVPLDKRCNLSVWHCDLSGVHHKLFGRCCDLFKSLKVQYMYFPLVGAIIYTYSAMIYLISAMIYLIGTTLYIIPVLQFDAKDEEGNVSTHNSMLSVEPIKPTETYSLEDEHWSIYRDGGDEDRFIPRCEWPNVQLPQKPLPPEPEPAPPAMLSGLVEKLMQLHHTNVDILLSLGRDPCKEYKLSKAPAVLARVRAGNKTCSICNRVLASTQSLRNHIWSVHMDETYQCDKRGTSVGNSYVLQVHLRKHQPEGRSHKCQFCGKGFATVGHRNQHLEVHREKSAPCQYCGTTFTHTRSLIGHEKM